MDRAAEQLWIFLVALALAATIAALTPIGARGDDLSDIPGAFVDIGIGAAPMAMGGAVAATAGGAGAIFWNPACLGNGERSREFTVAYCEQLGLVPYTAAAGVTRLAGGYSIGIGLLYSGDDVLSETTALVGASRAVRELPWCPEGTLEVGAAARTRWASFGNNDSVEGQVTGSALGFGLDVGARMPLTPIATLGVVSRDVINVLNWDTSSGGSYSEGAVPALIVGIALEPRDDLLFEIDLDKALYGDGRDIVSLGTEIRLFGMAALRGGYRKDTTFSNIEEYTLGAGAEITTGNTLINVDLGYLFGDIKNTMRFTLGVGI